MVTGQGVGGGGKSALRGEPHRHSEMKLFFGNSSGYGSKKSCKGVGWF